MSKRKLKKHNQERIKLKLINQYWGCYYGSQKAPFNKAKKGNQDKGGFHIEASKTNLKLNDEILYGRSVGEGEVYKRMRESMSEAIQRQIDSGYLITS